MGRKNKGGKKGRNDDWSDEETPAAKPAAQPQQQPQQSRKAKRAAKQQAKKQHHQDDDSDEDDVALLLAGGKKGAAKGGDSDEDDDDDSEEMMMPPVKGGRGGGGGGGRRGGGGKGGKQQPMPMDDDDDDDDDEEEEIPQPAKKGSGNNNNNKKAPPVKDDDDKDDDDEDFGDMDQEEDDDDDESVEQITFKILDEPKKKKKDKKEKKEKKDKKEKKAKKDKKDKNKGDVSPEDSEDEKKEEAPKPAEEPPKPAEEPKKKSKFELQMEAAMKKKEEEETNTKKAAVEKKKEPEPETPNQLAEEMTEEMEDMKIEDEEPDSEIMYGHGDDAWNDKSQAMRDAENQADDDPDKMMYGPNGKKLSNKERKKLKKEQEAAARAAEYEAVAAKNSREGAQFACSQTAVNENDPQWENSLDINIPNFSISAAGKILFKDASLTIGHGRRYGLVGPNGRGKSTLLKMIASRDLILPPRIDFLYVEQEVVADDTPAVDAVLKADKRRWDLMEEEKALMKKVDSGDESNEVIERLGEVVEELTNMGADSAEAKARRILYGLGFTVDMQTKPTKMFSGGWRMRISLARALFVEPTLLMLDEPTNHLDLNAVIWLDEYLQSWKKTLFVVSHDQDFLNSVCQEILHIEDLKLISYKGNYDSFKKAEKERLKQQIKAWEKQEKRLKELKRSGQSKEKAQQTVKDSKTKREAGARAQKKKNQAIAAGTEAAEMTELIKRPKEYAVKLEFSEVPEIGRPVMEVNNVHFRYSPKHPIIFDKIDFGIDMDSRICVVGPNGAGKSTLLKLLTGEVKATTGEVKRNPRLRMGIYNQHFVDRLPMGKTPVEHLRDRFQDLDYQSCRNRLGKYGLEGHAHEVVMRDLSGGQKARVVFVELSLQMPHILLLDEPTNNLDIETIDALCDAINEFNGGIIVVTHDQRLIEECECTLWVVEKQGVTPWEAGFDDYKENILRQIQEEVEKEAQERQKKLEASAAAKAEKIARLKKLHKKK